MTALYTVAEIRAIEQHAQAALPGGTLMQRAGGSAAKQALHILSTQHAHPHVLVLAGPGNNGGDALVAARLLKDAGLGVTVRLLDAGKRPADAAAALATAQEHKVTIVDAADETAIDTDSYALVIDGLFGIGLQRPITGETRKLVETINALTCPVLALDIPSGLNADTGCVVGSADDEGVAIRATHTITFIGDKPGLHTCNGRDHAGNVLVENLAIDPSEISQPQASLNSEEAFKKFLRKREHNTHKGSFGDVMIGGGASGMCGAAILAARAAAKCGAGRVYAGFLDNVPAYDVQHPEIMCRRTRDLDFHGSTLVVGPGLGTSRSAQRLLARALQTQSPLVLDADALNLVATENTLRQMLMDRSIPALLTPHPLEAARLLSLSARDVQADRPHAARLLAGQLNCVVILKGSGSIIATPDGTIVINTTGNPGLATAGTGDVLAGICGALLAQHLPVREAALAATWLHGKAADLLVAQGIGPIGLTASELIPCVRTLINGFAEKTASRTAP